MKAFSSFLIMLLAFPVFAVAQEATLVGTVTDEQGDILPGVNVYVPELERGAAANAEGVYRIETIPLGTYTLQASFIGFERYEQTITLDRAGEHVVDIEMRVSTLWHDEVVVTGVASRTTRANLSFTVDRIDADDIAVPASNVATTLQGKLPGIEISSASGAPGASPDIQLRGATSIFGSGNPLVIVDGVLTEGRLSDINAEDIASIEVVKGASASSLYGSRAANGVVNIITKRGSDLGGGSTRVTVRSELGRNVIGYVPDKTTATNRVVRDGQVIYQEAEPHGLYVNPYPRLTNPQEQFFDPGLYMTNFVSFQGNSTDRRTNLYASGQHMRESGVVFLADGMRRINLRANVDHQFNDRFTISASNFYSTSSIDNRANGIWDMFYYADPDVDLLADNVDGTPYRVDPNRLGLHENPLYTMSNTVSDEDRYRFMGNYRFEYAPVDFFNTRLAYGIDRIGASSVGLTPKGKLTVGGPPSQGSIYRGESSTLAQTLQADAMLSRAFGDLASRLNFQFLLESSENEFQSATGSVLALTGLNITNLNLASENIAINSYRSQVVANNYTGALFLGYRDRYILDALVRRDGVSLFGSNVRWRTFYRLAGAWRITQDFEIPNVQELKVRASYGTAGLRPPFEARFEVVGLSGGSVLSPSTIGNEDLRPAYAQELETGVDMTILNRLDFSANYASSINKDQILNVPVSAASGFATQWQNAGTLESSTLEFSLGARLIDRPGLRWNMDVSWDRTRQKVLELNRGGYAIVSGGVFRIAEGETFGTLYGHKWATDLADVANQVPAGMSVGDVFTINNEGYVVRRTEIGTINEQPIKIRDEGGNPVNMAIGDVNPDFRMNLGSGLNVRGVNLYMLWSWQQGGEMYNHMRRYMIVHGVGQELDQSDKPRGEMKPARYYQALTDWNNSHFVEDASFVKLRELSLTYDFSNPQLTQGLGIDNIRVGVIGRNLLTFTRYSGFDPELGHSESGLDATVLKFDLSSYPLYRTFTGTVSFTF